MSPKIFFAIAVLSIGAAGGALIVNVARHSRPVTTPTPLVISKPASPEFPKQFVAALDVARVFGRSTGCSDATPKLIDDIANESLHAGIDARVLAATIAVESGCDQYATSGRGAIGLGQIMPRIWKGTYNFEHDFNLLNAHDNIHITATILSGLVKQYGLSNGLRRYNGMGVGCDTCDSGYSGKIESLAGRR